MEEGGESQLIWVKEYLVGELAEDWGVLGGHCNSFTNFGGENEGSRGPRPPNVLHFNLFDQEKLKENSDKTVIPM